MNPQERIISNFSYEEFRNICDSPQGSLLGCDWEVWRERARLDYGLPPAYFDLPRTFLIQREIPGQQRYLEISSFLELTPKLLARSYPDGTVEGIYEPLALFIEAIKRGDRDTLGWLFQELSPEEKDYVRSYIDRYQRAYGFSSNMVRGLSEVYLLMGLVPPQLIVLVGEPEDLLLRIDNFAQLNQEDQSDTFAAVLRTGRSDLFDRVVNYITPVPPGFSVEKYIRKRPFQVLDPQRAEEHFPLQPLPKPFAYRGVDLFERNIIMGHALDGSNVQIIDFLRDLFQLDSLLSKYEILDGYKLHHQPVSTYSIFQRYGPFPDLVDPLGNIDLLLYNWASQPEGKRIPLDRSIGNIPLMMAIRDLVNSLPEREKIITKKRLATDRDMNETGLAFLKYLPISRQIYEEIIEME